MQARQLGAYELIRQLGEGGMAQVYLARDIRLGREVAVKVLDQHLAAQTGFRERFLREARVAAKLDHPNIVPLFDFGEADYLWYLVMPYVSGGSLQDVLRRAPLSVGEVVTYGTQIADALEYAHGLHVVHRDVKPANMLIHADGRVMLSDFGLAKILDKSARPAAPRAHPDAGTPEYMAPEQIEGRTDERSDIYGLGVVLYLLLTGHLPFTGSTSGVVMEGHLYRLPEQPRTLNPAVTPAVQSVVLRALAKHPDDRYQRASDLGAALLGALVAGDAEPLPFALGAGPQSPVSPIAARTPYATPWTSSAAARSGFASASDATTGTYPRLDAVQPAYAVPPDGLGGLDGMPDAFGGSY
ncbi:MAG TPA: serine/threonine-protein kinase, partial [Methylomirabilota bacterium]|nr:serine/threonine-protein kinase [Methylomirabilota bacterium]